MDVSGSHQLDVSHHIQKKPIDSSGRAIGDAMKHGKYCDHLRWSSINSCQ
jgi:hypothetical protein